MNSSHNGNLYSGVIKQATSLYSVHASVIYRIWNQVKETGDACHKRTLHCGRKRIQLDPQRFREVPLSKRTTLRSLACALGINTTSLARLQNHGVIRRHSNALKPYLKDENMRSRLRYCLSMLDESSMPHDPKFKSMHDIVFIDEKWFYMTQNSTNYYSLPDEDEPYRTCKSKNFIGKVMFLVAVARPRFNSEGNMTFSGKIGVFPFVHEQPERRTSVNRVAGTMEKKPISSITSDVNKMFLINHVLPAIRNVWPREDLRKKIFIQQDNVRCHVNKDDEDFRQAASEGGFDIHLTCQPPNSPDLNVLDLGFFNAIQSLQQKEVTKSVDKLIEAVEKSFDAFFLRKSDKYFMTLQSCMVEIMKAKGSNKYKIPHLKKDALYEQGGIPSQLNCDPMLVQEVTQYLENVESS